MRIPIHRATQTLEHVDVSHVPPPLVRLSPSGELVLVEMQGTLEMEGGDPRGGETIGTLTFPPGREDKPILQISHHRLEGTIVKLRKPLAVLQKRTAPRSRQPASPPTSPTASPTLSRQRARETLVTPPRSSAAAPASSSPMPARPASLLDGYADFSSPHAGASDGMPLPTTTSYAIVTLIRHKLLFSQRPEPIVALDRAPEP